VTESRIRLKTVGRCALVGLVVLTGLGVSAARAQVTWNQAGNATQAQAPVFKYYVWGQVRSPGAYSLGANPDLIELISAGGGPTQEANLKRVVLVKAVSKQRLRVNVERMLAEGDVVPLSPGDVVIVPRSLWYTIRDELWAVTTAAILVNLGLTIYALTGSGE
jgi:hypothetical protein